MKKKNSVFIGHILTLYPGSVCQFCHRELSLVSVWTVESMRNLVSVWQLYQWESSVSLTVVSVRNLVSVWQLSQWEVQCQSDSWVNEKSSVSLTVESMRSPVSVWQLSQWEVQCQSDSWVNEKSSVSLTVESMRSPVSVWQLSQTFPGPHPSLQLYSNHVIKFDPWISIPDDLCAQLQTRDVCSVHIGMCSLHIGMCKVHIGMCI